MFWLHLGNIECHKNVSVSEMNFLYSLLGQCTDSTVMKSLAWPVCVAYSKPVGAFPPDIS